jgi:hypothetical protein
MPRPAARSAAADELARRVRLDDEEDVDRGALGVATPSSSIAISSRSIPRRSRPRRRRPADLLDEVVVAAAAEMVEFSLSIGPMNSQVVRE